MVVEDNDAVRKSMARLLGMLGYQVGVACDGSEALELIERGGEVDLVLTDVAMPRLSGPELAQRLCQDRPELPILFMSGNVNAAQLEAQLGWKRVSFLPKPANLRQLADATRQTLDRAS